MTILVFFARAAGAGVVASYLFAGYLLLFLPGSGTDAGGNLSHRRRRLLGSLLPDQADMEDGASYIMPDGIQQDLKLLVASILVGVHRFHLTQALPARLQAHLFHSGEVFYPQAVHSPQHYQTLQQLHILRTKFLLPLLV